MGITSRMIEEHYEAEVASYRAEVRRLRSVNAELLAALRRLFDEADSPGAVAQAFAAILKATADANTDA